MASCGVCGRQVEVSDSGQTMPCICVLPSIEVPDPSRTCEACGEPLTLDNPPFCGACSESESDGLHEGPCEHEDGYGDDGTEIRCVKCLAAREKARLRTFDGFLSYAVSSSVNGGSR